MFSKNTGRSIERPSEKIPLPNPVKVGIELRRTFPHNPSYLNGSRYFQKMGEQYIPYTGKKQSARKTDCFCM